MLTDEQIKIASEWWAGKLGAPGWNTAGFDMNDSKQAFQAMFIDTARHDMKSTFTDEQRAQFAGALAKELASEKGDSSYFGHALRVDYHPEGALDIALTACGISELQAAFPYKTTMLFNDGGVQVKEGYGAQFVELLTSKAE